MNYYFLRGQKQKKLAEFLLFIVNPQIHEFHHKESKKKVQII